MKFSLEKGTLKFDKTLNELDRIVLDFLDLVSKSKIRYVIVSGYVAIFLGRSRTTEDIDLFIEKLSYRRFSLFFDRLIENGYWIVNTDSKREAFGFLEDGLAIRIAEKGKWIPNFEIKFPKKVLDLTILRTPLKVIVKRRIFFMSPLEVQIPFKLWLGSEKDIEDAVHISELFKGKLNKELMAKMSKELKVEKWM
ncbi:MAG: hypothetical protein KGH71_06120, partial [Candidatus Micrarchaeota archaeon]|nr:hypothetical protein [Candidatus Micrarchaeota archaeon]